MSGWKYISIVVLILLGGTIYSGYWILGQFNLAFNTFDTSYNQLSASFAAYTKAVSDQTTATTTATTTDISEISTTTPETISTTTPEVSTNAFATSTDPTVSFTFLQKDRGIYIGCTYQISWLASTTINSLEAALIDAGTRDAVLPDTSGLAKENTIEKGSQLNWKVGPGSPGAYYIKISRINNVAAVIRSKIFKINKAPDGSNEKEQRSLCEKTGGNLF